MLLNNQWITEEIKGKIKEYIETNDMGNEEKDIKDTVEGDGKNDGQ